MIFKKPLTSIITASTIFTLSACDNINSDASEHIMNKVNGKLQLLFKESKTVCFGRLMIDIPVSAIAVYGYAEAHSPIERLQGQGSRLQEHIKARLQRIDRESRYAYEDLIEGPDAMYGKTIDGTLPEQKLLFGVELSSGTSYRIESFIKLGEDLFIEETIANTPKYANKYGNSVQEAVNRLNDTAKRIRIRNENEVPDEVGVCIDGAFISKPLGVDGENFAFGVRLNEFPDVHFSIDTRVSDHNIQQETIEDIQRRQLRAEVEAQQNGRGIWYSGIKFLRRGEREFNGGKGYEMLARLPAQGDGTESHQFVFQGGGEANNELRPAFNMQLDTGAGKQHTARVPPSLTDEEAIALWDKLISSIRVRPTSEKTSHAAPPKIPLGNLQASGRTCPQTGWWECDDPLPLAQASSGVWLEEGQRMPMARVWLRPGWWQRWKDERSVGERAAVWRLAAYEAPGPAPSPSRE